jgi:hypothetical protein
MEELNSQVIRGVIQGKETYSRIPIMRKIVGSGIKDTQAILNTGISNQLCDLAISLKTGCYSLDNTLAKQDDYCFSFSTTRLLQLLPNYFIRDKIQYGILIYPDVRDQWGHSGLIGVVVNTENGEEIETFKGHPVSVLVQLILYAYRK